ncbi:MAG: hypothetical protein WB561_03850 [Terracidiphilus sp.]
MKVPHLRVILSGAAWGPAYVYVIGVSGAKDLLLDLHLSIVTKKKGTERHLRIKRWKSPEHDLPHALGRDAMVVFDTKWMIATLKSKMRTAAQLLNMHVHLEVQSIGVFRNLRTQPGKHRWKVDALVVVIGSQQSFEVRTA